MYTNNTQVHVVCIGTIRLYFHICGITFKGISLPQNENKKIHTFTQGYLESSISGFCTPAVVKSHDWCVVPPGVCLQHEELVLLLIQLRRSQARLRDAKSYYRSRLDDSRDNEKGYQFRWHLSTLTVYQDRNYKIIMNIKCYCISMQP